MKIITCQSWGDLRVGVELKSDMRGYFVSLADEEEARKNLKDQNPGALSIYNFWLDKLSDSDLYRGKIYLSPRLPPDKWDFSFRIVPNDHTGTIRNLKIYEAYPAEYRQKKTNDKRQNELQTCLELVDGLYYEKCLMKFPEESILLILEIQHRLEPAFVANFQNVLAVGLSYTKQVDKQYYFVSRQLCVLGLNDVLHFPVHCCKPIYKEKMKQEHILGKTNPLGIMEDFSPDEVIDWQGLISPKVVLQGQKLYQFLQNQ